MTVSDGVYKCTALLASQLKVLVDNGAISKFALLRVTELVGNKKLGPAGGNKKCVCTVRTLCIPSCACVLCRLCFS